MPFVVTNGVRLSYQRAGAGEPVVLVMGSSAAARTWDVHQTPALRRAGFATVTFDNRGMPPSDRPEGDYRLADLVADTAGLIEALELGPCHLVGVSLGALIAQELALARPDLVRSAVLMATRARSDALRRAQSAADRELRASGVRLPPRYRAVTTATEMLAPATLNDDRAVSAWLELFELAGGGAADGQAAAADGLGDRRAALRGVSVPCLAVAFADDRICPPHLVAEVADAIPGCEFLELPDCGHLGYLERPEEVNSTIIDFLIGNRDKVAAGAGAGILPDPAPAPAGNGI
ncbi:alpha/beta fold hydrolase [Actinomadura fibrosa]|uniref:Alpha/beta fold hydrolase n=1 Tax=Actinomadura fibrosa TaxID=111802 RepID=A0ABW2XWR9_9ACTN|nr:alpha/beta fold hydrolase [Actinomadura fibrosa]